MLIKLKKKGVSLLEALIAMFILGMVTLFYFNSSTTYMSTQQTLVKVDRHEQIAELILQGIMEYTKQNSSVYGTMSARGEQTFVGTTNILNVKISQPGVDPSAYNLPKVGDIFVIEGIKGRHTIQSITGNVDATISTVSNISSGTLLDGKSIVVIAFKKDDLSCFNNLDLTSSAPTSISGCSSLPADVRAFHNYWKQIIIDEIGILDTATIEVTDANLVKVTLDDVTLAKKISTCLFDENATTAKFEFPGGDEPIVSGIMSGTESPVLHYSANGRQQTYATSLGGSVSNQSDSCRKVTASTCRQSYSALDTVSVFLYRYTGSQTQHWKPTGCSNRLAWQCPAVTVEPNELSLWFIFDEMNHINNNADSNNVNRILSGDNRKGFFHFEATNLPDGTRILIFDDASESCIGNITDNKCEGMYKWGNYHDGLVLHLDTADLASLGDIGLEIKSSTYGIDKWRVLKSDIAACLIASGDSGSAHGDWDNREEDQTPASKCWSPVPVNETTLTDGISATATTIQLNDSSKFPSCITLSGVCSTVQIGDEKVSYTVNNKSTGTLTGVVRGVRPIATLSGASEDDDGNLLPIITTNQSARRMGNINSSISVDLGFYGGKLKIEQGSNSEIFLTDSGNNFNLFDNNQINIRQRGSPRKQFLQNATMVNNDMRARSWPAGTKVYEGDSTTVAAIMPTNSSHNQFNRKRIKKKINLKLSESYVCQ
ncbi:prepilin-type N-terminal cleavage/methylation domain-containing protein [Pelagibacteraceae bacterium]|nr:prepilin-type N-terminal cleavage/methylation domain-containing protein [Pelagibacteraceae bacterium]